MHHASHLLLIDDDPAMARLLTRVIEQGTQTNIVVETRTNSLEAQARIDQGGVDILVTDLEMPGVNGLELLQLAKRRNAVTQVLLITGQSTRHALLDALEMGATDYLLKPVDHAELVELVKQAHNRQLRWREALLGTWQQTTFPVTG